MLEEELCSRLTLSSPKARPLSFISFQRIKRQREQRQRRMPTVGVGYYYFLPTADARRSGFNRAHFKTQHSCRLCIWAPDRRRREERSEAKIIIIRGAGDRLWREKQEEEREEETKADTDNIYQCCRNMGRVYPLHPPASSPRSPPKAGNR